MKSYTRVQNDSFLALSCPGLSQNEIRILIFIFRVSNGCNREKASLIPRDFATIGIKESQIGGLLKGLVKKDFIYWDKTNKEMWINHKKLIENASFDEERLSKILGRNLRKNKVEASKINKQKLIETGSASDRFYTNHSQNTDPKDNKYILKTRNVKKDDKYSEEWVKREVGDGVKPETWQKFENQLREKGLIRKRNP